MEQNLADKLKIETEILTLKRELKNTTAQVASLKTEYAAIAALKENTEKQVLEQKDYLNTVQNDIASAKLSWATERSQEMDKLAEKMAQAENILKRKSELNEQEETIRQIEAKNTDTLNETRRLELKVKSDRTALEARAKEVEEAKIAIETGGEKNKSEMADFKARVLQVISTIENL